MWHTSGEWPGRECRKRSGHHFFDGVRFYLDFCRKYKHPPREEQNQAFNAILFFYRHVLRREFGKLDGVVRAKRRPYVPVVLSRREVDAVLAEVEPPYKLVALLLYGCGLRLAEWRDMICRRSSDSWVMAM